MILAFVNLHVHTEWSLLDGMCKIEDLIPRVSALGQNAVGITDHGIMHGVVQFYKRCKNNKDADGNPCPIKPIIGMEAYVVPDMLVHVKVKSELEAKKVARKRMTEKQKKEDTGALSVKEAFNRLAAEDETYFGNSEVITIVDDDGNSTTSYKFGYSHLILFASNTEGYHNLMQIATESQLTGFYTRPRIDMAYLKTHGKGIIATSACRGGEIPKLILRGRLDLAEKKILEYCDVFEEFYLEVQPGASPEQRIINQALIELSEKLGVPLVATSDAHYVMAEDATVHATLLSIQTDDKFSFDEDIYYIYSEQEMLEAGIPQVAIDNTQVLADKCNVEFTFGKMLLPKIELPTGYSSGTYIAKLCYDAFYKFIKKKPGIDISLYQKRLEYELDVIITKGLADYLLIVEDFLTWARKHNVFVGPGRGSAVGSLVCFMLRITTLDPIEHGLMFERFSNPLRPSMPDVDSDFEEFITIDEDMELAQLFKSGRQTVMEYIISKYGAECICQIGTFGTMGTRSVLKDVGRVLGIDHNEINTLNKFVPIESGKQWTLTECIEGNPEKDRLPIPEIKDYAEVQPELFRISTKLEGMPRHPSIHAAGVVISPVPVRNLVPLMRGGNGEVVAQFEMGILEELGILKMDFLGLRTLGALHKTLDVIEQRHGTWIDMDDIPLNDPETMKMIGRGYTDGVFQIESDGMKAMFKSMNAINFDNIVAGIALYRPGPMQFIPKYVACLNGHSEIMYAFPELEPILKDTFGVMIYQEQLMMVAKEIAGFDWITVDGYRKAVGKKKEKLIKAMNQWLIDGHIDKEKDIEIPGLVNRGINRNLAIKLADDIVDFGSYAFNKSHAAGYAKLVVITAYLKCHYPLEYMTPLISSYIGKDDAKITQYVTEARRMGIRILPPDVNSSQFEFSIEDNAIRFGLGAIKGLSKSALVLYGERITHGNFESITDFLSRFGKKELNKKSMDVLCLSGTLDGLCSLEATPTVFVDGSIDRVKLLELVYSLRGYSSAEEVIISYCDVETVEELKKAHTKSLYGKFVKQADNVEGDIKQMIMLSIEQVLLGTYISSHPLNGKATSIDWLSLAPGDKFDVICIVRSVRKIITRFGKPMAFMSVETLEGLKDVTVFSKEYEANINKFDVGGVRVLTMEMQLKNGAYSFIVKNIKYFRGQSQEQSPF